VVVALQVLAPVSKVQAASAVQSAPAVPGLVVRAACAMQSAVTVCGRVHVAVAPNVYVQSAAALQSSPVLVPEAPIVLHAALCVATQVDAALEWADWALRSAVDLQEPRASHVALSSVITVPVGRSMLQVPSYGMYPAAASQLATTSVITSVQTSGVTSPIASHNGLVVTVVSEQ
jgi:hypothetical protein